MKTFIFCFCWSWLMLCLSRDISFLVKTKLSPDFESFESNKYHIGKEEKGEKGEVSIRTIKGSIFNFFVWFCLVGIFLKKNYIIISYSLRMVSNWIVFIKKKKKNQLKPYIFWLLHSLRARLVDCNRYCNVIVIRMV